MPHVSLTELREIEAECRRVLVLADSDVQIANQIAGRAREAASEARQAVRDAEVALFLERHPSWRICTSKSRGAHPYYLTRTFKEGGKHCRASFLWYPRREHAWYYFVGWSAFATPRGPDRGIRLAHGQTSDLEAAYQACVRQSWGCGNGFQLP